MSTETAAVHAVETPAVEAFFAAAAAYTVAEKARASSPACRIETEAQLAAFRAAQASTMEAARLAKNDLLAATRALSAAELREVGWANHDAIGYSGICVGRGCACHAAPPRFC